MFPNKFFAVSKTKKVPKSLKNSKKFCRFNHILQKKKRKLQNPIGIDGQLDTLQFYVYFSKF